MLDNTDAIASLLADEGSGDNQPAAIKVGDKEYTPEQIAELETAKEESEAKYKSLQADYSKKAQRLAEIEKSGLVEKSDRILAGRTSASELSDEEVKDLEYMKKVGAITKEDLESILSKSDSEIKSLREKLEAREQEDKNKTLEQRKQQIQSQLDALSDKYSFIDKKELLSFMADKAKSGTILSPDDAAILKYRDKFAAAGVKPADLPSVEDTSKNRVDEPKPKIVPLKSSAMRELMREKLGSKVE